MTALQLENYFPDHDAERSSPLGILLKVVFQTLLDRKDPQAMQVLAEYLKDESNCQRYKEVMRNTHSFFHMTPKLMKSAAILYESDSKVHGKSKIQKYLRLASIGKIHDHTIDEQDECQKVIDENSYEDFPYEDQNRNRVALRYFADRKDVSVKDEAIAIVTQKDGWRIGSNVVGYLGSVCDQSDIPKLKKAISKIKKYSNDDFEAYDSLMKYSQQKIENVILAIQLSKVLEDTLTAGDRD